MSSVMDEYRSKRISADEAAAMVKSGDTVDYYAFNASSQYLDAALAKRAGELENVTIRSELRERLQEFRAANKLLEAQRLEQRTMFDLEMIEEIGYCSGIENYSRHLTGRNAGEPPFTLLDFFPQDYLLFIDESHLSIPQAHGMFKGDRSRKQTLVDYGFRL
ncbi:MAG TPA: hypothetical protein PLI07_02740, partial [Candidatus Hydrogenedentes bacterium]|nr:hypothetical protein [Candidatus Hydrogenedentota bacterium]